MNWIFSRKLVTCKFSAWVLLGLLMSPCLTKAQPPDYLEVGRFSLADIAKTIPPGWAPLTFSKIDRHTDYKLVKADEKVVVKAVSNQSASGLTRAVSISPVQYPLIQWQWKVDNILQKGDVSSKDGDDYPARIYITFAFDAQRAGLFAKLRHQAAKAVFGQDIPYRAISYIWASNSPAGSMITNAYSEQVMMFAIEGGAEKAGQWITEKRNIYKDYKQAFGDEPTMITGVAIMTDTDNTRESAIAWYGDILFINDQADLN